MIVAQSPPGRPAEFHPVEVIVDHGAVEDRRRPQVVAVTLVLDDRHRDRGGAGGVVARAGVDLGDAGADMRSGGAGRAGAELGGVEFSVGQFERAREIALEAALRGVGQNAGGDDGHVMEEPLDVVGVRAAVETAQQGELFHVVDGAQLVGRGKCAQAGQGVVARRQGAA